MLRARWRRDQNPERCKADPLNYLLLFELLTSFSYKFFTHMFIIFIKLQHTETFEKELVMTSDQASMKNQRLPKGFVYVPIGCLSKDKQINQDPCPRGSVERDG